MRTRTYTIEPGDVLTRGKCRVMILRIAGNIASTQLLRDRNGRTPKHLIRSMTLYELATNWEVAA